MAGCLCGGWTTDYLAHRFGIRWGRRLPCIVSYLAAAVCYATASSLNDGQAILAVLVVASFCGDFGLGAMWATFQDLGGPFSGTVLGAANMCGNIGAAVAISIVGRWLEMQSWSLIFSSSAKCYAIAAAAWLLVDPLNALRPRRVSSD
jgi:ACS family glucarate transporter-like MFS transporter